MLLTHFSFYIAYFWFTFDFAVDKEVTRNQAMRNTKKYPRVDERYVFHRPLVKMFRHRMLHVECCTKNFKSSSSFKFDYRPCW